MERGVPEEDVHEYVGEANAENEPETLESSLEFCAEQLAETAPAQASKLRSALNAGSR
jgi:hypothetical protein